MTGLSALSLQQFSAIETFSVSARACTRGMARRLVILGRADVGIESFIQGYLIPYGHLYAGTFP